MNNDRSDQPHLRVQGILIPCTPSVTTSVYYRRNRRLQTRWHWTRRQLRAGLYGHLSGIVAPARLAYASRQMMLYCCMQSSKVPCSPALCMEPDWTLSVLAAASYNFCTIPVFTGTLSQRHPNSTT